MKEVQRNIKRVGTKGRASRLLESRIIQIAKHYRSLTVRQLYYLLTSRFGYSLTRKFYKRFDYHLTKMRRMDPSLHAKFIDPTRHFISALMPYPKVELWVEKDSLRNFLGSIAMRYRISIQVLRGFASLSMYRAALLRAAKRGVRKILYVGDFDPSGLLIEEVAAREIAIQVERIALTLDQIKRHRPPFHLVNRRDSRAKKYIEKYGDKCWEVEAIRPRTLLKMVEEKLRENVPHEYLAEAGAREQAAKIARPVTEKLKRKIEQEVLHLLEEGRTENEILPYLSSKYGLQKAPNKKQTKSPKARSNV